MTLRLVEIVVPTDHQRTLQRVAERLGVSHSWRVDSTDGTAVYNFVVDARDVQRVVDAAQTLLDHAEGTRVAVVPVELALPEDASIKQVPAFGNGASASITREELTSKLLRGAALNTDYLLMVVLSTIIAVIGLISDNVAVVVGAMVVAPFLGPNLALSFATTMGNRQVGIEATRSLGVGLLVVVTLSAILGALWPDLPNTNEIAGRTVFGVEALVLAVASGAAGVLALTGSAPMTLVGVMVAVALLPPATVLGLMIGAGRLFEAEGAALLLLINIIGLNLAAGAIFTLKGISPRKWDEKEGARRSFRISVGIWTLALLVVFVLARRHGIFTQL